MSTRELTLADFEQTVSGEGIVLVDFWAAWCGPCRQFAPIFEKAAEDNPDIVFGKVDTEAEQQLAQMAAITSIPTLMLFRDGVLLFNQAGALPPQALSGVISQARELDMDAVRQEVEAAQEAAANGPQDEVGLDDFAAAHSQGAYVVDVREAAEVAGGRVPGAVHIPMNDIPARVAELPHGRPVLRDLRRRQPQPAGRRPPARRRASTPSTWPAAPTAGRSAAGRSTADRPARQSIRRRIAGRRLVTRCAASATKKATCAPMWSGSHASSPVPTQQQAGERDDDEEQHQRLLGRTREPSLAGGQVLRPGRQPGDLAEQGPDQAQAQDGEPEQEVELGEVEAATEQVVVVGAGLAGVLEPVEPVLELVGRVAAAELLARRVAVLLVEVEVVADGELGGHGRHRQPVQRLLRRPVAANGLLGPGCPLWHGRDRARGAGRAGPPVGLG